MYIYILSTGSRYNVRNMSTTLEINITGCARLPPGKLSYIHIDGTAQGSYLSLKYVPKIMPWESITICFQDHAVGIHDLLL